MGQKDDVVPVRPLHCITGVIFSKPSSARLRHTRQSVYKSTLNSSTTDGLGSWCLKGWWSWAEFRCGKRGIHDNPVSSHHQRHHHTEPSQWNTYRTRHRHLPKGGWRGWGLKIKWLNDLTHRPASKKIQSKP